jgi:hypothetical protein
MLSDSKIIAKNIKPSVTTEEIRKPIKPRKIVEPKPVKKKKLVEFDENLLETKHLTREEKEMNVLIHQGYGTKFDDDDIQDYKDSKYKKPAQRLRESLIKTHKKKPRIPKKVRDKIDLVMEKEQLFEDNQLPDNVAKALGMM